MRGTGYIVFAGCVYEAVALTSRGRVPTITRIVWRYRDHWLGLAATCAGLAWLGWHLLVEGS